MGRKQWLYTVLGCRVTLWKSDAHHNNPARAVEKHATEIGGKRNEHNQNNARNTIARVNSSCGN